MNPYMTDPSHIPPSDLYADVPLYGRYSPDPQICPADESDRDVFALGTVIIKSSHLHDTPETDYSYADANEVGAILIAKNILRDVTVPKIYFAGKIRDRQVLVQERLPGVTLGVVWPYLSESQKESLKKQAREILRRLHTSKPDDRSRPRSHIVQDPNILVNGRINPLEKDILLSEVNTEPDMGFMDNDLNPSNCIVNDDKIVGLIDWETAGYFGWKTAGEIHRRIRSPQKEHFANITLSEEALQDIMYWNDLYDDGIPGP